MPSDRSDIIIGEHFQGILDALVNAAPPLPWPVGEWERPKAGDQKFINPPYALLRLFPSAAQFEGSLADSQADIILRFQIMGVGLTERQAIDVTDRCRKEMKSSKISIPNRYVQDVRFMVVSGGVSRDDDLPEPFHNSSDLYELLTTPA
jgi:hypothetical protein